VAGARPNHQPIGGSDPNHQGIWSPPRAGQLTNFQLSETVLRGRTGRGEEDEDEEENGDEDADADADEDSDEEDKEVHGGAAGEQGAGDGKSDEDVRIIGEQSAQHHKEDGKRATEGVNDAAAAKKAKTSTLSTEQQSFVCRFNPAPAKIDKERKIATRNVNKLGHTFRA
jgi:hypothetical protein